MTASPAAPLKSAPSRPRLIAEFAALFIGVPLIMVATFGLYPLFPVIIGLAVVACLLLHVTPGWRFSALLKGPVLGEWRLIAVYFALTLVTCLIFVFALVPERLLSFPRHNPGFWLIVITFYPILSAFPQEIIYRSLFFERYQSLFPNEWTAILANGALFGFGHLFYENWVTIAMTACGGAIMGWAYLRSRSVLLAWVLHALAGQIIFTVGLGVYFYHGAVGAAP
ncbi:MAG: CPBP family intramembrane glutamic endopeptidase [Pseudomonadota bacterium]